VFTRAHYWILYWARWVQFTWLRLNCITFALVLFSSLCLVSSLSPSRISTKISYAVCIYE
jgi:hypothetical protein